MQVSPIFDLVWKTMRRSLIRFSRVLWLGLLVVMLGGLLKSEAAAQTVSFGAKTDFGTGSNPFSVAVGDFNGDGKLDLVTANEGSNAVSILLGMGTGSFGSKTDFSTGSGPRSVAVGDFNGDGKLDLAVANSNGFIAPGGTISILLGTGTGSFGAKTDFFTGTNLFAVTVGDFNDDGDLDLAAAGNIAAIFGTVSILLGTGTGSFAPKTDFATSNGFPYSVVVGDFNGDGNLDLVTANGVGSTTVSILLGTGTGSFGPKTDFGTGSSPLSVAVGDFNSDGRLDLAVGNDNGFIGGGTISILLGAGTGSFGTKTDFGTGGNPHSVAAGDFNGDSKLDLAVANNNANGAVSILLGTGTGSFGAKTDFGTGSNPRSVAVGDFNSDGKLDLAVANGGSYPVYGNTVSILLNTTPIVSPGVCRVSDLTPVTDSLARMFEDAAPNAPGFSLMPPAVEPTLYNAIEAFRSDVQVRAIVGFTPLRSSGFRPSTYQDHLHELKTKLKAVREAIRKDPTQVTACDELKRKIDNEIDTIHHIVRGPDGLPKVSSAGRHILVPAEAMDLSGILGLPDNKQIAIDTLARQHGLARPDPKDPVHFQLRGTLASQTVLARVESPVNILIVDPIGRKVGFDPATASVINQVGPLAFYTGPDTEPQDIEIGGAIPGQYVVIGTGTGTGFYKLTLERVDEDGEVLETKVSSGTISFGEVVSLNINISCPTVTLTPSLPNGVQGATYNQSVIASPTDGNYTYAVTTNILPPGLTLNPITGVITGTPSAPGNYAFVITATGYGSCAGSRAYNLLITGNCSTITVNPATLPAGTHGTAYSQTVSATGGIAPYTFSVFSGALPGGLTLNATTGEISGTPTATGSFVVTLRATSLGGCTGQRTYVLMINCATVTIDTALPNGTKGMAYNQSLTASPVGTYTYSVILGNLPPGFTLSSAGVLSGTSATTGTYTFTVRAQTVSGCQGTRQYMININP